MAFRLSFILFIIHFLAFEPMETKAQERITLGTGWQYRIQGNETWRNCEIPSSLPEILWKQHLIPDPFYSNNEDSLQYLGKLETEFRTTFEMPARALKARHKQLVLPGIDCFADVYVNGKKIGTCQNAFRTWRFDPGTLLRPGTNELLIKFHSADLISDQLYRQLPRALPGEQRVTVRKPQYHFGWDFGPKYIWQGITSTPYLLCHSGLHL